MVGVILILSFLGLWSTAFSASGPNTLLSESTNTPLAIQAEAHLVEKEWRTAGELALRLWEEGEKLVPLTENIQQEYFTARRRAFQLLRNIPEKELSWYRERVDWSAQKLYENAKTNFDRKPLLKLLDLYYLSSWSDKALELLGDLFFQDGNFPQALNAYRQLLSDSTPNPLSRFYPNPKNDLALIGAKKFLCRIAMDKPPNQNELKYFETAFPDAKGLLAGTRGSLIDIVRDVLSSQTLRPLPSENSRWSTFAGSVERTGSPSFATPFFSVSSLWNAPLWTPWAKDLENIYEGVFPHHVPVVVDDQIIVNDDHHIRSSTLDGKILWELEVADQNRWAKFFWPDTQKRLISDNDPYSLMKLRTVMAPHFSLQSHRGIIYTRFVIEDSYPPPMEILALDARQKGRQVWRKTATSMGVRAPDVEFGGPPVVNDFGACGVFRSYETENTNVFIYCLEPRTGELKWISPIMNMILSKVEGRNDEILSSNGIQIFYLSNRGAAAALDAESGAIEWISRYSGTKDWERLDVFNPGQTKGLNPPVVFEDKIFIAPADSPYLHCLSASTGELIWRSDLLPDLTHILGIKNGYLIVSGANSLRTFDLTTGRVIDTYRAWQSPQEIGRGMLSGSYIYWPVERGIKIVEFNAGKLREVGNLPLAFGPGVTLIEAQDFFFVTGSKKISAFKKGSIIPRIR
jgi:outer membrane protein assembly factor BamB